MIKFRLYYDKDKETAFLNEMSRQGHAFTGFFAGFYSFDRCQPGEYVYQIDITEGLWKVSKDYREFMRDMNVEIICLWGPWVILRKKAAEGPFALYTDVESNLDHYRKISMMFKMCMVLEMVFCFIELIAALNGNAAAWGPFLLLGAIALMFVREVVRLNGILYELKGRTGDPERSACRGGKRKVSGFLAIGLFLNAIALLIPEVTGRYAGLIGFLKGAFQGIALVLMGAGLVFTVWSGRE
ncbi:MAG: DUF2812 domain-containing protein [Lachnospiraceae bacterium]|nr:DUF2812 domain-containing protein [uncultured Acetatifactor sp.]MCI8790237.1 DUF2812 domain-containing protein [Lachnospiraceae bacterium]